MILRQALSRLARSVR